MRVRKYRRSHLEQEIRVLELLQSPKKKSNLMVKANLEHRGVTSHLDKLISLGLVEKEDKHYKLTQRGFWVIAHWNCLMSYLYKTN